MGTTLNAFLAGSFAYKYVVAIEGCRYLLTNATPAQALAAWAGTEWTEAIGGLFVDLNRGQSIGPFKAFAGGEVTTLRVTPNASDRLGREMRRRGTGARTSLKATLDSDDDTIPVASTAAFPPAPGELHMGVECCSYTGTTPTSFTGVTRGLYSPFRTSTGGGLGRPHRAGFTSAYNTTIEPVVSEHKRTWIKAQVGIWIHREVGGVLDSRAEAHLVFAGAIEEARDDAQTGQVVIALIDVVDKFGDATLMRDQFKARIAEGIYLRARGPNDPGAKFFLTEKYTSGFFTKNTAEPLEVVVGATGTNKLEQGYYTVSEIASAINAWLAGEKAAGRIDGTYSMETPAMTGDGYRTIMKWNFTGVSSAVQCMWSLEMYGRLATFLGITETPDPLELTAWGATDDGNTPQTTRSPFAPLRIYIPDVSFNPDDRLRLVDVEGSFWDNFDWMPPRIDLPDGTVLERSSINSNDGWGVFLVNGQPLALGELAGNELVGFIRRIDQADASVRWEYGADARTEITQIFFLRGSFRDLMLRIFYSTATPGFNHPVFDEFPQSLSLGVPASLLGATFEASLAGVPEADREMTLVVDKTQTMEQLFNIDLVLRGVFLIWKQGGLRWRTWTTPAPGQVGAIALREASKAMPAGALGSFRSPTTTTTVNTVPIVRVRFNRDWATNDYRDTLILEDRAGIDEAGNDAPTKELQARNMTRDDVAAIAPTFLARMPAISRPEDRLRRSIDQRYYELLAPGDVVELTDGFARDPITGERKIVSLPALVVQTRYALGGANAANPTETDAQQGEVDLQLFPGLRVATYAPACQVDETANTAPFVAGYSAATNTLRVLTHRFSEAGAGEGADDASFEPGDKIQVIERDPSNPAAPLAWDVTITDISGDDIEIDAALTGWTASTRAYVRSQRYAVATAQQRLNAYQADDSDQRIQDLADPYQYALGGQELPYTPIDATLQAELIPEFPTEDGYPRDVAIEQAIATTLNVLLDHGTAYQAPDLDEESANTSHVGWRILSIGEDYFGELRPTVRHQRRLTVAPWIRSTNGAATQIRVTLARNYPAAGGFNDHVFSGPISQATWSTSSTTGGAGAPMELDLSVIAADGVGVIVIEAQMNGASRGLALCREGIVL